MPRSLRKAQGLLLAVLWLTLAGSIAADEKPAAAAGAASEGSDATVQRVRAAIVRLDAQDFAARETAARALEALAADPATQSVVASELARALAADSTSIEARARLEDLARTLPQDSTPPPAPSAEQIVGLIDQLRDPGQPAREAARRNLLAMLSHVELIGPVLSAVDTRLNSPEIENELRRALAPILDKAREAWVTADPQAVVLPAVSDDQLAHWVDELARDGDAGLAAVAARRETARRELIDLLVRDDTRDRVLPLVEAAMGKYSDGEERLLEIVDFARPAMAAEVWSREGSGRDNQLRSRHMTLQHLLVGVPQFPETAERATHFDRIDDRVAHCVSGNTLTPGNYPVGVAIPHPVPNTERMFFLVNLPTPRRRLAYEFAMRRDEATRLAEISHRTLAHFLNRNDPIHDGELLLLCQLDPNVVSRFVGTYFQRVPDATLTTKDGIAAGPLTVHGGICYMMTRVGTREAVPALEQTGRSGRLGKLTDDEPVSLAWLAALSIADRDPWPGVDEWLAGLIENTASIAKTEPAAELGASAAARLLSRHGLAPDNFELSEAAKPMLETVGVPGFRFDSETGRQEVLRWWRKQASSSKAVP